MTDEESFLTGNNKTNGSRDVMDALLVDQGLTERLKMSAFQQTMGKKQRQKGKKRAFYYIFVNSEWHQNRMKTSKLKL